MQRRRILASMLVLTLGLLVRPVAVSPAAACSCAMDPDPIGAAAKDPQQAVFTGVVQAPAAQGTPVVLTRWFREAAPQPVIWLDNAGFEDPMGGMCGTSRPPANTEWIFAAYRTEDGKFGVNLCSTHAPLDTDEGQALLRAAVDTMGEPSVPAQPEAGGSPPDPMITGVAPIVIGLVALAGLIAGLFVAASRRRA